MTERAARRSAGRGAPGRPRVPRRVREREMVAAASRIFADRGYHATSMDEIADRAGITKPMLYSYFRSKEGLFAACVESAGARLRDEVRAAAAAPDTPADERLWRGLRAVLDFVDEHREAWQILYPGGDVAPGPMGGGARRSRDAMTELLGELLARDAQAHGLGEGAAQHAAALAHMLTAATIAAASWWLEHPDEPKDVQVLRVMNLVWMGLGDLADGRIWLPSGTPG